MFVDHHANQAISTTVYVDDRTRLSTAVLALNLLLGPPGYAWFTYLSDKVSKWLANVHTRKGSHICVLLKFRIDEKANCQTGESSAHESEFQAPC